MAQSLHSLMTLTKHSLVPLHGTDFGTNSLVRTRELSILIQMLQEASFKEMMTLEHSTLGKVKTINIVENELNETNVSIILLKNFWKLASIQLEMDLLSPPSTFTYNAYYTVKVNPILKHNIQCLTISSLWWIIHIKKIHNNDR